MDWQSEMPQIGDVAPPPLLALPPLSLSGEELAEGAATATAAAAVGDTDSFADCHTALDEALLALHSARAASPGSESSVPAATLLLAQQQQQRRRSRTRSRVGQASPEPTPAPGGAQPGPAGAPVPVPQQQPWPPSDLMAVNGGERVILVSRQLVRRMAVPLPLPPPPPSPPSSLASSAPSPPPPLSAAAYAALNAHGRAHSILRPLWEVP